MKLIRSAKICGPFPFFKYNFSKKRGSYYVLDKKSGKYIKTIQVSGRPHLGGIAYDPVAKNILVKSKMGKSSALASFSLKEMKAYKAGSQMPIKYNHQIAIPAVEKASTVTYYDGQLFVGFFNMYGRGKVAA